MTAFCRILLLAAVTVPLPVLAQAPVAEDIAAAQPAKSAQDCADELLRNKEAIAASGESPQDFFHRCWWDSVPGQATPIKTPRATWDPGHGRAAKKATTEANKVVEPKKAVPIKPVEAKPLGEPQKKSAEVKHQVAPKQQAESKQTVVPKTTETKRAESKVGPATDAPTKSEAKPTASQAHGAKGTAGTVEKPGIATAAGASRPSQKEKAGADKIDSVKSPSAPAKKGAVVTAPDAAPASVKGAAPGAVVVKAKPAVKTAAKKTAESRGEPLPTRLAGHRPRAHAPNRIAAARPFRTSVWEVEPRAGFHHPRPSVARVGYHGGPHRFRGGSVLSGGPVFCIYATPDARGHSSCVPMPIP